MKIRMILDSTQYNTSMDSDSSLSAPGFDLKSVFEHRINLGYLFCFLT